MRDGWTFFFCPENIVRPQTTIISFYFAIARDLHTLSPRAIHLAVMKRSRNARKYTSRAAATRGCVTSNKTMKPISSLVAGCRGRTRDANNQFTLFLKEQTTARVARIVSYFLVKCNIIFTPLLACFVAYIYI